MEIHGCESTTAAVLALPSQLSLPTAFEHTNDCPTVEQQVEQHVLLKVHSLPFARQLIIIVGALVGAFVWSFIMLGTLDVVGEVVTEGAGEGDTEGAGDGDSDGLSEHSALEDFDVFDDLDDLEDFDEPFLENILCLCPPFPFLCNSLTSSLSCSSGIEESSSL
jgi:hypothetical protein